jgi:SAM-dependent methyltransferase
LPEPFWVEAAAGRYAGSGRFHQGFVRGKLRGDPVYGTLVHGGFLPESGTLVDLGCGRGILLAALHETGHALDLVGIEIGRAARVAERALGSAATILRADLRDAAIPPCDAATLVDVLHYLAPPAQAALVSRVSRALRPGGVLVIREADAAAGPRFLAVRVAERVRTVLRGAPFQILRYRTADEWGALLCGAGLSVSTRPMGEGTPFSNVLLVGVKPGDLEPPGSAFSLPDPW